MQKPNGTDLLAWLIELYADQVGVKVTYSLTEHDRAECERETHT